MSDKTLYCSITKTNYDEFNIPEVSDEDAIMTSASTIRSTIYSAAEKMIAIN